MIGFILILAICCLAIIGYLVFRASGVVKDAPEREHAHVNSHVPADRRPHPSGPSPIPGSPSVTDPKTDKR
jgi:hypothetical protein